MSLLCCDISARLGTAELHVVIADITTLAVDAIVNAANSSVAAALMAPSIGRRVRGW